MLLENNLACNVNKSNVISPYISVNRNMNSGHYLYLCISKQTDINEENILQYNKKLLDTLIKDRTTGRNIIWATSDYEGYGDAYCSNCEILSTLITGSRNKIIPQINNMQASIITPNKTQANTTF